MEYRIIEKETFYIVGLMKTVTLVYHGVNPEIAQMWASLTEDMIRELKQLSSIEPRGLISASLNFTDNRAEGSQLDHVIGVATSAPVTGDWNVLTVPASTWGVFTARGKFPETLQNVWGRIYSEWFPMSGYESVAGAEILWNEGKDTSLPNFHSEIWIPIRKV